MSALVGSNKAKQQAFLQAFAKCGTIRGAIGAVAEAYERGDMPMKLSRTVIYQWKKDNYLDFADKLEQAQHEFREYLEDLALKYVDGTRPGQARPGQNPTMLIAMLNASWPDKWRRNEPRGDDAKEALASVRLKLRQFRDGSTGVELEAGGKAG